MDDEQQKLADAFDLLVKGGSAFLTHDDFAHSLERLCPRLTASQRTNLVNRVKLEDLEEKGIDLAGFQKYIAVGNSWQRRDAEFLEALDVFQFRQTDRVDVGLLRHALTVLGAGLTSDEVETLIADAGGADDRADENETIPMAKLMELVRSIVAAPAEA